MMITKVFIVWSILSGAVLLLAGLPFVSALEIIWNQEMVVEWK